MSTRRTGTRVLITGAAGFVGPYVAEALRRVCGPDLALLPTAKAAVEHPGMGTVEALDVTNEGEIAAAITRFAPTHVVHLAGIAAPAAAGADPETAWRVHVHGARMMAGAILRYAPDCWLLHVGSGMVYGESAKCGQPLGEDSLLAPLDEYAVTKAAADLALGAMCHQGLRCIRLRPFNHTGPGQGDAFVIPAFAKQIAMIEAGLSRPVLKVGNLEAERDFLDVRDVAQSYALAVRASETLVSSVILNIASGVPRRIDRILQDLLAQSRIPISVEQDPSRLRPVDVPRIIGDASRARALLGWAPEHDFEETTALVLEEARNALTL